MVLKIQNYFLKILEIFKINKKSKKYKKVSSFRDDVTLMFNNCRLYNGPDSEYTETADILEILFAETMERIIPEELEQRRKASMELVKSDSEDEKESKPKPKQKQVKKKAGPKSKTTVPVKVAKKAEKTEKTTKKQVKGKL